MKIPEVRSIKKNSFTERDTKFLQYLKIGEEASIHYTKNDIDFLRRTHKHGHKFINSIKKTNPKYLPAIQRLADLYDGLLSNFGIYYLPNYHDKHQKIVVYKKNRFTEKDIKFLENLKIGEEKKTPRYTKSDIDFLRRAHKNEHRFIRFIEKISPQYLTAVQRLADLYYDLLAVFAAYNFMKYLDISQNTGLQEKKLQAKEKYEPADNSNTVEWSKRQKLVEKGPIHKRTRAPKRTEQELPFPLLKPYVEKNRTRKQMKLSLPPNLIKVVNKMVENEEFSRNEWIEYLIEKELKAQYPYLLQNNQNKITLENIA